MEGINRKGAEAQRKRKVVCASPFAFSLRLSAFAVNAFKYGNLSKKIYG